jgi:DNA-binding response OmpR family regulator
MTKLPHVLIVEDDVWLAEQHVRTLKQGYFQAEYVTHALAAMDVLDSRRPDVIVLDVLLAGPNAFTLLHELRSHTDLASIPVVLCTNTADALLDMDIASYGVTKILNKTTMTPADLVAAVKWALV